MLMFKLIEIIVNFDNLTIGIALSPYLHSDSLLQPLNKLGAI